MTETGKNSILVVDDESSNIIVLTHILGHDYTVRAAKNGLYAIKAAKKFLPDLILLDVIMPDMDGYEVLSLLKGDEETREIPVIFVTGLDNPDDKAKGLALGAVDYICKPFSFSDVRQKVRNQIKPEIS